MLHKVSIVLILSLITCFVSSCSIWAQPADSSQWQSLFDGQSLAGWYVVVDGQGRVADQNLFVPKAGEISVYPVHEANSPQPFAALITNSEYENYHLFLQYKWGNKKFKPRDNAKRDAGVLYHQHGKDIIWPSSVECQIQEEDTGDIWLVRTKGTVTMSKSTNCYDVEGTPVTRGKKGKISRFRRSHCREQPGWNTVELKVKGDSAQYFVNGHLVNAVTDLKYWDDQEEKMLPLTKGRIALQAEGAELIYRDIKIRALD